MAKIYYDSDTDVDILKNNVIAIVGYGNQGRAQALNMRDSGLKNIIIGNIKDEYWQTAKEDGFEVYLIEEACKKGDIIFVLVPDEVAPEIYKEKIEPYLKEGNVLNFASGYNITYKFIQPSNYVDVVMVAPRMIGKGVRELYLGGKGVPSFIAVKQDASGKAKDIALAIAKAIGSTKKSVIEVTFKDETFLDLMSEHVTWPLIISVLTEVYNFEIKMGHPEEAVLMELYGSKEPAIMMEEIADIGLFKQLPLHSHTSQYGQLTRYEIIDKDYIRKFAKEQYRDLENGRFAREWRIEQDNGLPVFKKLIDKAFNCNISQAETKLKQRLK